MLRKFFVFMALTTILIFAGVGVFSQTAAAAAGNSFPKIIPLPDRYHRNRAWPYYLRWLTG